MIKVEKCLQNHIKIEIHIIQTYIQKRKSLKLYNVHCTNCSALSVLAFKANRQQKEKLKKIDIYKL